MKQLIFSFLTITSLVAANNTSGEVTMNWLEDVKESYGKTEDQQFMTKDQSGRTVTIKWAATDILSPDLAAFKKNICELASKTLTLHEVEFLHAHPEAASEEMFLKPAAPFFENGLENVDWEAVKQKIESTIKQFYLMDLSSFGPEVIKPLLKDVYFPISITDTKSGTILGFALFAVTPALPYGDLKLINLVTSHEEKDKGLDLLLLSSIFKILPKTERIFTFARPTCIQMLETYHRLGFTPDLNPTQDPNHKVNLDYLTLLEYKADRSTLLQKKSNDL